MSNYISFKVNKRITLHNYIYIYQNRIVSHTYTLTRTHALKQTKITIYHDWPVASWSFGKVELIDNIINSC